MKNVTLATGSYISGGAIVGSIAGYLEGTIENCTNMGVVEALFGNAGGIVGRAENAKILNCANSEQVVDLPLLQVMWERTRLFISKTA